MKIKTPKFIRKFAAKRISNAIHDGYVVRNNIELSDVTIDTKGEDYTIHMEFTVKVNKRDIKKAIKESLKRT